jgi:hypothetical protein
MALTITFAKSGTNTENAVTGDVTLLDGSSIIKQGTAFSGGNGFNPIDDGTYRLRLDIRGDESTNKANIDGTLQPFFGIQKVGSDVVDANGNHWNMQVEWGTIRARLNPQAGPDHGDYLHGKQRPRDWTHGCICDRSQVILNYLWNLASPPAGIDVVVSGGLNINLEELVRKNPAPRKKTPRKRRPGSKRPTSGGAL